MDDDSNLILTKKITSSTMKADAFYISPLKQPNMVLSQKDMLDVEHQTWLITG